VWVRSDESGPQAACLAQACPHLTRSRAGRGEGPVHVGPVTAKSVAEGVLRVARWLTFQLQWSFGCGKFIEVVRAAFPRDVESDPWDVFLLLGWYETTRGSGEFAAYLARRLSGRTEFLGRLYSRPLGEALDAIQLEPLCRWLHHAFAGLDVSWLREQLELEFIRAAEESSGSSTPGSDRPPGEKNPGPNAGDLPATPVNLFARLPGNRYQIAFGGKEETVPMLAGLCVVEYLLKQSGTAAHVLEINRTLSEGNPRAVPVEDAFARSEEQKGLDGFTADARQSPEPCSDEDLKKAKEEVKSLEEQAAKAWDGGEHGKAKELDRKVELGHRWIREQERLAVRERRGQLDQNSEVERVRSKWTNNFRNACEALRTKYGLSELADHLERQTETGTEFKYNPVPGIEWAFDPKPR
jgi:hypothetical protein